MLDELNLDMSKTYIYDGLEYILTGRKAVKTPPDPPAVPLKPRRSKRPIPVHAEPEPQIMVEIKPAPSDKNNSIPTLSGEKKWVRYSELFVITDMLEDGE